MLSSPLPTINALKQPTSDAWVEQAIANLDIILLDHSHCERKAAGVALNMMFRYPSNAKIVGELTAIAREELEHFELVNQGSSRDKGKMGHVVNKCCRNKFSDLLTCPKMVKKHSTFAH